MATERRPIGFGRFGGLRLDLPLDEVSREEAVALLDVDWADRNPGSLRSRAGAARLKVAEAEAAYTALARFASTQLLAVRLKLAGGRLLTAINTAGTELKETAFELNNSIVDFVGFGSPTARYMYACRGGTNIPVRWDGTNFSTPTATVDGVAGKAMPKIKFGVVWPEAGNRLIAATGEGLSGPNGAQSSLSHVWASDPGDAESWHTVAPEANYVQILPGDGEEITGICHWGGMVFVAKETRLFVFYGTSVDGEGAPEFPFRVVNLGSSMILPGGGGAEASGLPVIVAGDEGIYLLTQAGVMFSSGGAPVLISDALSALSLQAPMQGPMVTLLEGVTDWSKVKGMMYLDRRLYLLSRSGKRMFIYDLTLNSWLVWSVSMVGMVPWEQGNGFRRRLFFSGLTSNAIFGFDEKIITDAAITPVPSWQSGFYDLGSDDEKTLVEAKLWGKGDITLSSLKDLATAAGFSKLVKLPAGELGQGRVHKSQTGSLFSHKIELVPGASLQRLVRYSRETRVATTKTGTS